MKAPEKFAEESLSDYAARLADLYSKQYSTDVRKRKGQFFTPKRVANFMAGLVNIPIHREEIRILDPGAGVGVLVASLCDVVKERLYRDKVAPTRLVIDAYENDPALLPLLEATLEECVSELNSWGYDVKFHIYGQDFVLHNAEKFTRTKGLWPNQSDLPYDVVIANPPYYKINKESPHSIAMKELIYGQPNIYALFMALAIYLLREGGVGVFITPRSFCSGLYYKRFREWFLENTIIDLIHIFESRKEIFDNDGVLQENIILKVTRCGEKNRPFKKTKKVIVSVSTDKSFEDLRSFELTLSEIVYHRKDAMFIRIPTSFLEIDILSSLDRWDHTLNDLGLEISTGPVVPFRAKEHLCRELDMSSTAPLVWMHNVQGFEVLWPVDKNGKEIAILISEKTKPLLLPVKNYVLVKRFSSKEQRRRLHAGVLLQTDFQRYGYIGIENHLNYIHRPKGTLSEAEAFGIAGILNTTVVDRYFRALNGNTQVNATDIRSMPFPPLDAVREIGEIVWRKKPAIGYELDRIVAEVLNIDAELVEELNERKKVE